MAKIIGSSIVGRHEQLSTIDGFLSDDAPEPSALLIEGESGIGKTALFDHAVATADVRGDLVLLCRPTESELDLSYAGLIELLRCLPDDASMALPPPQARVLDLLHHREEGRFDRLSLSLATVAVIDLAAPKGRIVVAIDDVQWLDPSTRKVLAYALRRLRPAVRTVVVRRSGSVEPWPLELYRSLPDERRTVLTLGPLDPADVGRVLRRKLGWAPAWPRVLRIAELSRGNPFYALEIARSRGSVRSEGELDQPLPERLADLVHSRLAALPARARSVVEATSVLRAPTVDLVRRLIPRSVDLDRALEDAERSGVLTVDGGRLRFEHPILASAAYASITKRRARQLHRDAAGLSEDVEERARHLAAAAEGPDASLAPILDEAAERAFRRGAPDSAAELLAVGCRLTPAGDRDALLLRRIALGRLLASAGDAHGAIDELRSVIAESPPGVLRARALYHLMYVTRMSGSLQEAVAFGVQAAEEARGDPAFQAEVYELLSRLADSDVSLKLDAARKGLDALDRTPDPDPEVAYYARAAMVEAEFLAGLGIHLDALDPRPESVRTRFPPVRTAVHADDLIGRLLIFDGRIDDGLAVLRRHYDRMAVENRSGLPAALAWMLEGQLMAGRFPEAVALGEEALERAAETGSDDPWGRGFHALSLAMVGRLDEARSRAVGVIERPVQDAAGDMDRSPALIAMGLVAMAGGNFDEAAAHLRTLDGMNLRAGIREPRSCAYLGEYVEALVGGGHLEEAAGVLDRFEGNAERANAASSRAIAARCRALLCAARGDLAAAGTWAERSIRMFDGLPMPFERARSLLVAGQIHRRRKEKRLARELLVEALLAFDAAGAPIWADRARNELSRVPARQRPTDQLTPTEQRIAELAAAGLTNKEIAERAFMSLKTVEVNLTRVYRKLGVPSRAALAARFAVGAVDQT